MWHLLDLRAKLDLKSTKLVFAPNYPNLSTVPPPFFFVPWNVLTFCIPPRFIFFLSVSNRCFHSCTFLRARDFSRFFSAKKTILSQSDRTSSQDIFFVEKNWVLFDQKVKNKLVTKNLEKKKFWNVVATKSDWKLFWVISCWEHLKSKTFKIKHSWTYSFLMSS